MVLKQTSFAFPCRSHLSRKSNIYCHFYLRQFLKIKILCLLIFLCHSLILCNFMQILFPGNCAPDVCPTDRWVQLVRTVGEVYRFLGPSINIVEHDLRLPKRHIDRDSASEYKVYLSRQPTTSDVFCCNWLFLIQTSATSVFDETKEVLKPRWDL